MRLLQKHGYRALWTAIRSMQHGFMNLVLSRHGVFGWHGQRHESLLQSSIHGSLWPLPALQVPRMQNKILKKTSIIS